jgi:type IV pilus assembly protein PilE
MRHTLQTLIRRPAERLPAGYTLIELAVVIAIAAILAAIAVPAYSSYVRQGRRTDAKSAILDLASLEERYFSTSNSYTNVAANLGYPATASFASPGVTVGSGYYQVTIPTVTAATTAVPASYTITATAILDQLKDTSCYSFTVTSTGVRSALNSSGADNTANCW